jgi:hypothetical protein
VNTELTFLTPAEVAGVLKISPKSVIARFSGMQGVLTLPDEGKGKRETREKYRQLRIPKHVLDGFIESNTVQASTQLNRIRNRRKVRTMVQ